MDRRRFEDVFSNGRKAIGTNIRACSLPGTGELGLAVSRKAGCHARRNRLKRRVAAQATGSVPTTLDIVLIIGAGTTEATASEIRAELEALMGESKARWEGGSECC